jgi:hypothetical protein
MMTLARILGKVLKPLGFTVWVFYDVVNDRRAGALRLVIRRR